MNILHEIIPKKKEKWHIEIYAYIDMDEGYT